MSSCVLAFVYCCESHRFKYKRNACYQGYVYFSFDNSPEYTAVFLCHTPEMIIVRRFFYHETRPYYVWIWVRFTNQL